MLITQCKFEHVVVMKAVAMSFCGLYYDMSN